MPTRSSLLVRAAGWVSTLGHPLLTTVALGAFVAFRLATTQTAAWLTAGLIGLVVLPLTAWNYYQTRTGTYTNFDVSVREQRRSFYPLVLVLLGGTTALLALGQVAAPLRSGMLCVWLLLAACYLINFRLKVSLHAALSFFIACAVLTLHFWWGMVGLGLASLVAASRLVLGRHSTPELFTGAALGLLAGGGLYVFLR